MASITSITTTFDDGTIVTTSGPFTPVIAPTPEEIQDVVVENKDGSKETFVPEVETVEEDSTETPAEPAV